MKTIYAHPKGRFEAATERVKDAYLHRPVKRPQAPKPISETSQPSLPKFRYFMSLQ